MIRRWAQMAFIGAIALLGLGCAHARLVEVSSDGGGVVAIPDNSNSWPSRNRRRAEALMARQCPGGYVIEREQEVVTGQIQHTSTNTNRHGVPVLSPLGLAPTVEDQESTVSATDVKEWRIWFRPRNSPLAPAVGVVPAGGPAPPGGVFPASGRAQ